MLRTECLHRLVTRCLATEVLPNPPKPPKVPKTKREYKIPADVSEYFASTDILSKFHPRDIRKKQKPPDNFYVADKRAAELIAEHLTKPATKVTTILEANPGPGLLTELLVRSKAKKIHLFEANEGFARQLREDYSKQQKRVIVHDGDLVNLWKLVFQDRVDNGSRASDLLEKIPKREWTSKPKRLYAGVGSLNFFRHLITSMSRQTDLFAHGRFDMFLVMPPLLYIHLTCNNQAGYLLYRANSILFQILFEHKFIKKIPRQYFLPWQYEQKSGTQAKLAKFNSIDPGFLYLVQINPRRNIFELCPLEDLQAMWYFVKQNCISRKHRVIPNLEKWAPGCGPRLIINIEEPEPLTLTYPKDKNVELPEYSTPSTTMSNKDFYTNMNIFTEFGDLRPSQILTLFSQFRKWPEYTASPFLASLENSLLKMETSDQENIDILDVGEEDYVVDENKTKGIDDIDKS